MDTTLHPQKPEYARLDACIVHGRTARRYVLTFCVSPNLTEAFDQWYRNHGYLYGGKFTDLNDFIRSEWEGGFVGKWDANDMLTLMRTWWHGDVSRVSTVAPGLQGDLAGVLGGVKAKGLIMPCKTDLYFPVSQFVFYTIILSRSQSYTVLSRKTTSLKWKSCERVWQSLS